MVHTENYTDLKRVLFLLKKQIIFSIPYVPQYVPECSDIETLFNTLKQNITYQNDPFGVEFLQSLPTLFQNGGRGDCDCFTISAVACLYYFGFKDIEIVLAGNKKYTPSHIYVYVENKCFDLTQPYFNSERKYKFKQHLKIKI